MPDFNKEHRSIQSLVDIMRKLLAPDGCPWDREQSPKTLTPYAIEEAFELAEAVEKNDIEGTKEELGDLLLQVVFQSAMAENLKQFTLEDVIESICTKLIRRHPHVFGEVKVSGSGEVLQNWAKIKDQEKKDKAKVVGFGIPVALPALQRAQKIGDKTKTLKFDWTTAEEVLLKVDEEILELKEAMIEKDTAHIQEELGDVFFVLAQLARKLKLEAETVARLANQKFERRFTQMLDLAKSKQLDFSALSLEEKENLWTETKRIERQK